MNFLFSSEVKALRILKNLLFPDYLKNRNGSVSYLICSFVYL